MEKMNYEESKMEVILFDDDAFVVSAFSANELPIVTKTWAAAMQAEADADAYK